MSSTMISGRVAHDMYGIMGVACLWGSADFLAQTYESHKEAAKRRARGEIAPTKSRPTATQMYELLDKPRIAQSSSYAIIACPLIKLYRSLLRRQNIVLTKHFGNCALALIFQQAFFTPILMYGYFAYMTALRGGFSHPERLMCTPDVDDTPSSKWSVIKCILSETSGFPLMVSWASFTPIYALAYFAPFKGYRLLLYSLCLPWLATLSYAQSQNIL